MDPVSFTASIIAVIGAARTGAAGLRKLNSVRKAPRQTADLIAEVANFQSLLERIQELVAQADDIQCASDLHNLVARGGDKIHELNLLLASSSFQIFNLSVLRIFVTDGLLLLKIPTIYAIGLSSAKFQQSDNNQARIAWFRASRQLKALQEDLRLVISSEDGSEAYKIPRSSTIHIRDTLKSSIELHHHHTDKLSTILSKLSLIEESTRECQQLSGKSTFQAKTQTSVSSPLDSASSSLILSPFSSNAMTLAPDSLRFSCDPFSSQGVSGPPSSHTWRVSKARPKCVD